MDTIIRIPDSVSKFDNVYDVLNERGMIDGVTDEAGVRDLLGREKIKFYIGFDPTADCLHVGHLIQIIAMSYMLKYGHTPVALVGGGTGMIGDPSGRTDMRKVMSVEEIDHNCRQFKKLFDKYLPFDDEWKYFGNEGVYSPGKQNREPLDGKAISVNNAEWIRPLNYVEFSYEIGKLFNVRQMLRSDAFKTRMEREMGLSFYEFGYMLLQGYDFMVMARDFGLKMEMGGADQWTNIIAGVDLARKACDLNVFGMTFGLLTTSDGKKMGKTAKGALWLDADRVSPYEFFQYWRNVADADVDKCLRMLTFLPMDEVRKLSSLEGSEINKAKEVLAYEITKTVHGKEEAEKALTASMKIFVDGSGSSENMPTTEMNESEFKGDGAGLINLLKNLKLVTSTSDGFRTVEQGGIKINGDKVTDKKCVIKLDDFKDGELIIQKGKKKFHRIILK
ncbi:tyrosine--tRNA ligase [Alterileibacterium massiliense]|uniref:tyrosine--tRNA ligase n=1 Tax=Alterileibacterium massiliense TaxID=1870997 RepID=UPI0008D930BB|nr:tyrosine--tRNA ligase [Alterileibacterium massiliense]